MGWFAAYQPNKTYFLKLFFKESIRDEENAEYNWFTKFPYR
jgi:hypothetical protein